MAPLIMQRMSIERKRTSGVWWVVFGGIWAVVAIWQVTTLLGSRPWISSAISLVSVVIALVFVARGLINVARYRREIATFTAENGVDAGKR
jgi:hypothetical protein